MPSPHCRSLFLCALALGATPLPATPSPANPSTDLAPLPSIATPEMMTHLVTVAGDTRPLRKKLKAAEAGAPLSVGFIGGSITLGDGPDRYSSVLTRRLRERLRGEVKEINAGIGGTGSDFASYRARQDLLRADPDVVFVEFAVNDAPAPAATASMEALVRQLLSHPRQPAVIMLGMLKQDGANAQSAHMPVARHYALPFLSIRDAIWPALSDGRLVWSELYRDNVHPARAGHALIATLLSRHLEDILRSPAPVPGASPADTRPTLPPPLARSALNFAATSMMDASAKSDGAIRLLKNTGWSVREKSRHGPAWVSDTPGAELRFEFDGNVVALLVHRAMDGMGDIETSVDDGAFQRFSLHIPYKLMDNSHVVPLADSLPDGAHTLVVRHAASKEGGAPAARVELRRVLTGAKEAAR